MLHFLRLENRLRAIYSYGLHRVFLTDSYYKTMNNTINELKFIDNRKDPHTPIYQLLSPDGTLKKDQKQTHAIMSKILEKAQQIRIIDEIMNSCQRQGRIAFYMQAKLEEISIISSTAALDPRDMIFMQYRESSALYYRGFSLKKFINALFGNLLDYQKGRMMPMHYAVPELNIFSVSSPLATQIIQAVGAAYAYKLNKEDRVAVVYFGDGATSEGDFHAAMNFASVLKCPVLFLCRNNQFAISTHIDEQHSSWSIASYAPAYNMPCIRVDGSDAFAVYDAVSKSRETCLKESVPVFVELVNYRGGHHSTSDDSSYYREKQEIADVMEKYDGIKRLKTYMHNKGLYSDEMESKLKDFRQELIKVIKAAEGTKFHSIASSFDDVYDEPPIRLQKQREEMLTHIKSCSEDFKDVNKHEI